VRRKSVRWRRRSLGSSPRAVPPLAIEADPPLRSLPGQRSSRGSQSVSFCLLARYSKGRRLTCLRMGFQSSMARCPLSTRSSWETDGSSTIWRSDQRSRLWLLSRGRSFWRRSTRTCFTFVSRCFPRPPDPALTALVRFSQVLDFPYNGEPPRQAMMENPITPNNMHFVRNHGGQSLVSHFRRKKFG
jgi:hypothetical protein